ncbi:transposase [Streptomyces europaeiscabiei]|uniref:transposase n=1 Tax=Streptomyces europaeiscabiei TaxID=146819 RepID=UPI000B31E4F3
MGEVAGEREALVAQPHGRRGGEHQVLDAVEEQAVRQAVLDHRPCDLGLAGQLWTRAGVGDLIAKLYRVRLTEQGVGKYLRRWGLSFQRPDKRASSHSAHRSRKVRAWLADHPDRIELHFLPSYSPELNPDELVNADLKRSLPMHSRARDQAQLAAETRRFFHRRQRQPHIVRGYFGGPHVRYTLE